MSIEKSVVTKVTPNGTWEGQYGLMYKYEIEFENGQGGEYLSKFENQTKFVVGNETEYERTERGQFVKIKPVSNFQPGQSYTPPPKNDDRFYSKEEKSKIFDSKDKRISKLACLKSSIELVVNDKIALSDWKSTCNSFMEYVYDEDESMPFEEKAPF